MDLRICLLLACLTLYACVPNKKYQEQITQNNRLSVELDTTRRALRDSRLLRYDLQRVEADLEQSQSKLSNCQRELGALRGNYRSLENDYNEILQQNTELLSSSSSEISDLTGQLSQTRVQLDQKERRLRDMEYSLAQKEARVNAADSIVRAAQIELARAKQQFEEAQANLNQTNSNLNQLNSEYQGYQAKLEEMKRLLDAKDANLFALRKRVNEALLGFSSDDLTISERNGKIYVSLSQNLLFPPGSDRIDSRGKDALRRLTPVLSRNADVDILVEGHTDSDGGAALNWDLSVKRATEVVKVMTDAGLDPKRVIAAGRSYFDPIAPNNTAANKAKNRRVEIILTPNLDELYRVINE